MKRLSIGPDGAFELLGRAYRIPERFTLRQTLAYRCLIEPIPYARGERIPPVERRLATRQYLLWRAAACVIPFFRTSVPPQVPLGKLETIHAWISRHRPDLAN